MQFISIIKSLFIKQKVNDTDKPQWSDDRYNSMLAQRNLFLACMFISIACVIVAVLSIVRIVSMKRIDPFVIQVDQASGSISIVNHLTSDTLSAYDSLSRYFIKKYIEARETYNPVDFDTSAKRYIRLSSTDSIYSQYIRYITLDANNPKIKYNTKNTTYIKTKSWSKLDTNKHVCRFSVIETAGEGKVLNKIAIVEIQYQDVVNLAQEDQNFNPVGFTVIGYRVDDDNS